MCCSHFIMGEHVLPFKLKVGREVDVRKLRGSLREHVKVLKNIPSRAEPKPGELAQVYLEEEFER